MAGRLGRVLVGGTDCGGGFALGPRLVVTAHHVIRDRGDKPVVYVPAAGEPVGVEWVRPDAAHDAAILWLAGDVEFLTVSAAVREAAWRVESPPPGSNEPELHGTVTTARMTIVNASGEPVEVVQLAVDEQLGDYEGYSGSAVVDSRRRAVLALLVQQKPLRTRAQLALGEESSASNVLYAVPIGDVVTANGLPVRASRPRRFDVGLLLLKGMVTRPGLLDEAVGRVIGAEGGDAGAGLVVLRGAPGAGKTVLARQVAADVRVWAEFTDGIVMLRTGQGATPDGVTRQLQETLMCLDRHLADVLDGQRLLLLVDDVWDRELLATLRASLPPTVVVLATTRGVYVADAVAVPVGAVSRDEAIQILARGAARTGELDQALADLARTLFHSALLLNLAAAQIHPDEELVHPDEELALMFGAEDNLQPVGVEPGVLIGRADTLRTKFSDAPTTVDDQVDLLVRGSLDWLGSEHRAQFELLAVYKPGTEITQPMLEDLWDTSSDAAREGIKLLVRAGLAQPVRRDRLTIELHDLITAWLHHACGRPGDSRNQPVHQRLAGLCVLPDGSPGKLTRDRAEWLAHHLVSAGAWDRLDALPTLKWRSAFLAATGSDAAFLDGLDLYARAAAAHAPDPVYHAVRAWLFAAHVRALIGTLPISMLVAMTLVGDPIAGITQACQHPSAGEAVPAALAAVADRPDTGPLLERALAVVGSIPDDQDRSRALTGIAKRLADAAARDPALIERALAVVGSIPDDFERTWALAGIAKGLADAAPQDPALIDRALALAETIPHDRDFGQVLADIATELAAAAPRHPALIDRALAVAETIPHGWERNQALAGIAERLAGAAPGDPALIDRALAVVSLIPGDPGHNFVADYWRCRALAGIAGRLAVIDRARTAALIDRALAVAETIRDDWAHPRTLASIAGRLADAAPGDPALIDRALAVAGTIRDDHERTRALASIAERLADAAPGDPALIDRALAVAGTIRDDHERTRALASIAERLADAAPGDPALIDRALAVAETIPHGWERSRALAGIAKWLAGAAARDPALIDQALALAGAFPSDRARSEALAGIAERLADAAAGDPALIDRAVTVAGTIPDRWWHIDALAAIGKRLAIIDPNRTKVLIDRALAMAETIPDDQVGWARAGIAERLAGAAPGDRALINRALAVAETIPDDRNRSRALAGIAGRLAVIDPARTAALIDQALALAETIYDRADRSQTLAGIAERLAGAAAEDPALIDRAVTVAGTIPDDWARGWALAGIAEQLAGAAAGDPALINRALALAETIPDDQDRSRALASIAERLAGAAAGDPALINRALAVAETIPDDQDRSRALAGIAERLAVIDPARTAALIDQALALAETIPRAEIFPYGGQRSRALADIAERLAGAAAGDPALIDRALALAETILDDHERIRALASIAERLADAAAGDPALIDRALVVAGSIPDDQKRTEVIARIRALTMSSMFDELSRWRLRPLTTSMELLNVFLGNSHDKTIADRIGHAVLKVTQEFQSGRNFLPNVVT